MRDDFGIAIRNQFDFRVSKPTPKSDDARLGYEIARVGTSQKRDVEIGRDGRYGGSPERCKERRVDAEIGKREHGRSGNRAAWPR
jgi:hypothetical protein